VNEIPQARFDQAIPFLGNTSPSRRALSLIVEIRGRFEMADLLSICGIFLVSLKLVKSEADKHSGVFVSSFHPLGKGTVGGVERLVELRA